MAEKVGPQCPHGFLGHTGDQNALPQLGGRRKRVDPHHEKGQSQERGQAALDQRVDGPSHQVGAGNGQDGGAAGQQHHQGEDAAMGVQVTHQTV